MLAVFLFFRTFLCRTLTVFMPVGERRQNLLVNRRRFAPRVSGPSALDTGTTASRTDGDMAKSGAD